MRDNKCSQLRQLTFEAANGDQRAACRSWPLASLYHRLPYTQRLFLVVGSLGGTLAILCTAPAARLRVTWMEKVASRLFEMLRERGDLPAERLLLLLLSIWILAAQSRRWTRCVHHNHFSARFRANIGLLVGFTCGGFGAAPKVVATRRPDWCLFGLLRRLLLARG